ncbi:MAG: hypothetical protein ACFE9R_20185 [Candidatus Hermodarchaeota archaeon]
MQLSQSNIHILKQYFLESIAQENHLLIRELFGRKGRKGTMEGWKDDENACIL